jgi:UDP-N-acetylmuramoyl-tripeptide--D-alanyl-D-alanine ligase
MVKLDKNDFLKISGAEIKGEPQEFSVNGVTVDSRKVFPGEAFFAIKGNNLDGHGFIKDAFSKGAEIAVVEKKWLNENIQYFPERTFVAVNDTLKSLQELANNHRRKFSIPLIAITGSNGKTTTKDITAQVLSKKMKILKTEGNLNNHIGMPLTLLRLNEEHRIAVVEIGINHKGELMQLCEIAEPTHGIITNIGRAHLEFLSTVEGVAEEKSQLFKYLGQNGTAFVNIDDELVAKYQNLVGIKITYGQNKLAQVRGKITGIAENGCINMEVKKTQIYLQIPGKHQFYNALAACAVGLTFGVEIEEIKNALETFRPGNKRMEIIDIGSVKFINDSYNANPDSVKVALETLKNMEIENGGRKVVVFGDMFELGEKSIEEHRKIGKLASELRFDFLFTVGNNAKFTATEAIKSRMQNVEHFNDKHKLARYLKEFLQENDIVLIKGSRGMKMEEILDFYSKLEDEQELEFIVPTLTKFKF